MNTSAKRAKLDNIAPVLLSADVRRTAEYYRSVFGFKVVAHYEATVPFAALCRDRVEIVLVQARHGQVEPNILRHGAGYDVYLDPEDIEGVDLLHAELVQRGASIMQAPQLTPYGSYEFVVEDVDGRRVGVGRIKDKDLFFKTDDPSAWHRR
ncbi:MAG TPA: VOC family protein [Acidimicrobiales bacterium]|nr:VOC family protein [Acidimicrobiales bacterium]